MIKILQSILLTLIAISLFAQEDNSWMVYDDSEVAIINITVDPEFLDYILNVNSSTDSTQAATVKFKNKFIDETIDSVGFRVRGNTSRASQKKSFKLSFNSFEKGGKFYGLEKINLNGEHNDPSIIRTKLSFDLFERIGMKATRSSHAAVYINGDYYGVYISVEHIDETYLDRQYEDSGGNLWKCLFPADLEYEGETAGKYANAYDLKTNEDEFNYDQLIRFIKIINNSSNNDFADSLETILVVPEFIKYLAINVLVSSWDDYRSLGNNYYLYYEPEVDKFHWIPYDYDNSFGVDWQNAGYAESNPYFWPTYNGSPKPLADRILFNKQYKNLYSHFLDFYNEKIFSKSANDYELYRIHQMITPFAIEDEWRRRDYGFTVADFNKSYSSDHYENQHVQYGLREYINLRSESLENLISYVYSGPNVYDIDWWPKNPGPDDSIYVSVAAWSQAGLKEVKINYISNQSGNIESFPMNFSPIENTLFVEEADRWFGIIPPLGEKAKGEFFVEVVDELDLVQDYPRTSHLTIEVSSKNINTVVINEILAINDSINKSPAGRYSDWIELYNTGESQVNLSGSFLTDKSDSLTVWDFPQGTVINSKSHLLVWCDKNTDEDGLHADFKLSGDGEFIALVSIDGSTIIDSLTFGVQTSDLSYGRYEDGSDNWQFLPPTPNNTNSLVTDIKDIDRIPNKFQLSQNYPNPFNPTTNISYSLTSKGLTRLIVYDLLGREVATLVNEEQNIGHHNFAFDASQLSSGIYIYQLRSGNFLETKKMILLK